MICRLCGRERGTSGEYEGPLVCAWTESAECESVREADRRGLGRGVELAKANAKATADFDPERHHFDLMILGTATLEIAFDWTGVDVAAAQAGVACTWKHDATDEDDVWHTECGQSWCPGVGTPTSNGMRFCPYCGLTLLAREIAIPEHVVVEVTLG